MTDILLTTINARYSHTSLGLRYLFKNLGPLQERSKIIEFDLSSDLTAIVEDILNNYPLIIGIGIYIWNAKESLALISLLKKSDPELTIIIGGPEVSYNFETNPIFKNCDFLIPGEADQSFPLLVNQLLEGEIPKHKVFSSKPPNLSELQLPYDLYTCHDLKYRRLYLEASRGCPYKCDFCLSSIDKKVRHFPIENILNELRKLWDRGARQFKFVDRTFNLDCNVSNFISILNLFIKFHKLDSSTIVHFEVTPSNFHPTILNLLEKLPPSLVQFEIGIQTFNSAILERINRKQAIDKLTNNLQFIINNTNIHTHVDLIVGLPGEELSSIAKGFNLAVSLNPNEIQLGILKRLKGTKIDRHDTEWEMVYNTSPPYDLIKNKNLNLEMMQKLNRFAKFWNMSFNKNNFTNTIKFIWELDLPFESFLQFSEFLFNQIKRDHSIQLDILAQYLYQYLTEIKQIPSPKVAQNLLNDYKASPKRKIPKFLKRL